MTLKRIFVQPAPLEIDGQAVPRVVRKPGGMPLAAAGEWVNSESYWLRRQADGDVVLPDNPPSEDEAPTPAPEPAALPAPTAAAEATAAPRAAAAKAQK